ncbi:MAG: DUF3093 domain-containing protein [Actinobacteria bacterium]|nr:DUF3093 domain-containing protein [Actinomycetota bacterium]
MNLVFSERLLPATTTYLALSLSGPMVLLAALPFGFDLALILGVAVPIGLAALATWIAPIIKVTSEDLIAGRFKIPRSIISEAKALDRDQARFERGPGMNANARMLLRGDIPEMVRIELNDPEDPTPYILVSTRKAQALVSALGANRA